MALIDATYVLWTWLHVIEEFILVNDSPSNPYCTFCRPKLAAVGNVLSIITEMNFNSTLLLKAAIKEKNEAQGCHAVCVCEGVCSSLSGRIVLQASARSREKLGDKHSFNYRKLTTHCLMFSGGKRRCGERWKNGTTSKLQFLYMLQFTGLTLINWHHAVI